ncbi:probable inactive tRNA-specific adenosine deaminase-like protein 3 [Trichonephila inaurata madagascariensis]|uniref:Probable inactive tRNA-specific adenosine deaminase-like protein 3 n=1 Tax=Trichonephila inaurata madagascariensis TaxID=2747483 RepID=A0A8X6XP85_9ARAC|nr:probable inactive tRNA-specific adenosine deaminase-like protein 3 [Trichonephila inaurata madagascariensis]
MMISEKLGDNESETKKRKLLMEYEQNIRKKIHLNLEKMEDTETKLKIFPILGDEYFRSVETEKMYVGKVNEKKETSRLIKELSSHWPLAGRSHLKRVRWTQQKDVFEILIRPVEINESSENYSLMSVLGLAQINTTGLMDSVAICEVPKYPALTYDQYKVAKEIWPVQFREDKNIEKSLKGDLFNHEEQRRIVEFMNMCISTAQYGDEKVGCVIVDPVTSKVIAIANDRREVHPIQHAVMVAVDLVARSQGGGSWDITGKHVYHHPFSKEEMDSKISKIKKMNPGKDAKKLYLPYLCTGYDAYISREPCIMCSMALVHSRIRRVFYIHNSPWGALGSQCKLHIQEGLNHHYDVFRVELEDSVQNCNESEKINSKEKFNCNSNS